MERGIPCPTHPGLFLSFFFFIRLQLSFSLAISISMSKIQDYLFSNPLDSLKILFFRAVRQTKIHHRMTQVFRNTAPPWPCPLPHRQPTSPGDRAPPSLLAGLIQKERAALNSNPSPEGITLLIPHPTATPGLSSSLLPTGRFFPF